MKISLVALGGRFLWLGQKVNIAITEVDGCCIVRSSENSAQLPCYFGLVISVTDVTLKIYSVLASNLLTFTLCLFSCNCPQRDVKLTR